MVGYELKAKNRRLELIPSECKLSDDEQRRDEKQQVKIEWRSVFKGNFVIADFNKRFSSSVTLLPALQWRSFRDLYGLFKKHQESRGELIRLDDPGFCKHFVVYGTDQIEARYVLSTSLMRRITAFAKKCGRLPYMSFVKSHLYVAIPYEGDLLEVSLRRSVLDHETLKERLMQIALVVGIVDDLALNTRIWTG